MSSDLAFANIGDLPLYIGDGNYSGKYPKASEFVDKGVPFISASDFSNGRITPERFRFISAQQHSTLLKGHIRTGDVLLVTRGNGVGDVAWVDHEFDGCNINAQIVLLRADEEVIHNRYLYYLLSSELYKEVFNSYSSGSAQPQLPIGALKKIEIKYPSYEEQIKIAKILSNVDNRIFLLRETNATLEAIAQALFKSWFVDFDPVYAKQQGRAPEGLDEATAALFPDSFEESELGLVPRGWKVGLLGETLKIAYGKNLPTNKLLDSGYPVFGGNGQIGFSDKYLYETRQVLVSCRGAASGKVNQSPPRTFVTNNSLVLESNEFTLLPFGYLKGYMLRSDLIPFVTGSAQPQVTIDNLKNFKILVPTSSLLKAFEILSSVIEDRLEENNIQSQILAILRDTLLPRLISGQLRLPEAETVLKEATA